MAPTNDLKNATSTYGGFLTMVKYGTIAVVLVAAFVVMLIAS
jgi:hypothetical protein